MNPLEVHIMLHKLHNWSLREFTDASGHKCIHVCIPCEENGIDLAHKGTDVLTSIADVTAVGWNFMAFPSKRVNDKEELYGLIPVMPKKCWEAVQERGLVDPERKNFHQVVGNIKNWPYRFKNKYNSKKA